MVEKWCVSPHVVISIYEGQINISGIKRDSFSAGSFITWEGKLDFVIGANGWTGGKHNRHVSKYSLTLGSLK
jgi:hypothetical protein